MALENDELTNQNAAMTNGIRTRRPVDQPGTARTRATAAALAIPTSEQTLSQPSSASRLGYALTLLTLVVLSVIILSLIPSTASASQIYVYERPNGTRLVTDHIRMDPNLRLVRQYAPKRKRKPARFQIPGNFPIGQNLNVPGGNNVATIRGTGQAAYGRRYQPKPMQSRFDTLIMQTAATHGVDPSLVRAVVQAESAFKPNAVSSKGATGLMQLMPGTAERYGVDDRRDPRQNVSGGVRYLADLLEMFDDNIEKAVAAYNAGENAVIKHKGIPPYRETKNYVRKVIRLHRLYRESS